MTNDEIKSLYSQSESEKTYITGQYAEVARYTMPYTEVYNIENKTVSKKINDILSVVLSSGLDLKNFVMSTMLNSSGGWASAELDKETFEQISLDLPQVTRQQYNELNSKLDLFSTRTFKKLGDSNFYNAVAKAMMEAQNLGTGCVSLIPGNDKNKPFSFIFTPINSISFTEDALGRPSNTFRKFAGVTEENFVEMFGIEPIGDIPKGFLVESCVKEDGKYRRLLTNEEFDEVLYDEIQDYPAHVVFRWDTSLSNAYGIGIGMYLIDDFRRLERYNELYRESAELLVNPPLGFHGSVEFMQKMSFTAGSVSHLGNDKEIGGVAPIGLGTQLIPIENEIMKLEQTIRDGYMSQPLGTYTDRSQTTATEVSVRIEMFRNQFAGVYENLAEELLKVVFVSAFKILVEKGEFDFDKELIQLIEIRYENEITKKIDLNKANDLLKFKGIADTQFMKEAPFMVNGMSILEDVGQLMGINGKHFKTEEEATELYTQVLTNAGGSNEGTGTA